MLALLSESRTPAAAERDIQGGFNLVLSGGWRGVLQGGALEEGGGWGGWGRERKLFQHN